MKLKPVDHVGDKNAYCGPSVISAITGMKSGEAARLLRSITGKGSIKGSSEWAVVKALKACGLRVVGQNIAGPGAGLPTVAAWLKATHGKRGPNIWLLVAGNHWQAVQGNRYVCGLTKEVVPFDHPKIKRRAKVSAVYLVFGAVGPVPAAARKPKVRREVDPYRRQFEAHAKARGWRTKLERQGGVDLKDIMVQPCPDFPQGIGTMHYDWAESLSRLKSAQAAVAKPPAEWPDNLSIDRDDGSLWWSE